MIERFGCDLDGSPLDKAHPWNGGDGRLPRDIERLRMPDDLLPFRGKLVMLCGPPAGGKSTYLMNNCSPGDAVICLDSIMQELTGLSEHDTRPERLHDALRIRNEMLRALSTRRGSSWFIVSSPNPRDRLSWRLMLKPSEMIVLAPHLPILARRIKGDPSRRPFVERMIGAAERWWQSNTHLRGLAPIWREQ